MKIIKNSETLRGNYIPEKILFREKLVNEIEKKLKLGTGNILIFGDTGCGKTLAAKYAIKKQKNSIFIDINCVRESTFASVAKKIIETITNKFYIELGKSKGKIAGDLMKVLKRKRTKPLIFLFDEIDKLIDKSGDHQQILNPILEATNSNVILISNKIEALDKLDRRLMSRLSPKREFVEQYFTSEIFEILKYRAKISLIKGSYDLIVLAKISKWCNETSGDIREALNLFFEIAHLAKKKSCRITEELIKEARESVEEIEFDRIYLSLPFHQKIIVVGVAVLSKSEVEGYAEHKRLYKFYENALKSKNKEAVKERQFENYLRKLSLGGIIQISNKTPKNRRGRIVVSYPTFDVQGFLEKYVYSSE